MPLIHQQCYVTYHVIYCNILQHIITYYIIDNIAYNINYLSNYLKLPEKISQSPRYNQSRQRKGNRGNVHEETNQELLN